MIYLVEIEGAEPVSEGGAPALLCFSTGAGYVSAPTDTPATTVYLPRVLTPGTLERHMWRPGATRGRGEAGYGVVELANADGGLDHLLDWAFDGRAIRILRGDPKAPRAAFATALAGTVAGLTVSMDRILVRFVDRAGEVAEKLVVTERYAGDNVPPDGVEGTEADIKGQAKPLVLGECENLRPIRVNASKLIYQVSVTQLAEIVAVYEGGNAIAQGVQRASVAALEANAPDAGKWDYALTSAGSYIRLGSNPSLEITATVREGADAAARTAGQIASRLLQRAGVASGDILGVDDLDAAAPGVVGWCAMGEAAVGEALDAVCGSVGAAWVPTRDGRFRLLRLEDPAGGTPVATLHWHDLIGDAATAVRLLPTTDDDSGVPAYEVALSYQRNWTVMAGSQVAGAVAQDRRDWLAQEWRTATASDPAVWDPETETGRHPLSKPIRAESLLRAEADAEAEAQRLLGLYGAPRLYLGVTVHASAAAGIDLGDVVALVAPRFGLDAGRQFAVVGMAEDFAAGTTDLFLWG